MDHNIYYIFQAFVDLRCYHNVLFLKCMYKNCAYTVEGCTVNFIHPIG